MTGDARRRHEPLGRARRPARARRPGPGRGVGPGDLRELDASVRPRWPATTCRCCGSPGRRTVEPHAVDADYFSRGAYLAVACLDYPRLVSRLPPDAFAPFTAAEWLTISGFSQPYDVCLDWPRSAPAGGADRRSVVVPVLIVGGDLDSLTPLADAPEFGPKLGDDVSIVTLQNTVHVTSEGDNYLVEGMRCARRVIRSFLRGALNSSCAGAIPALHTPGLSADARRRPRRRRSSPARTRARPRAARRRSRRRRSPTRRCARSTRAAPVGPGLRGGRFAARGEKLDARTRPLRLRRGRLRHRHLRGRRPARSTRR